MDVLNGDHDGVAVIVETMVHRSFGLSLVRDRPDLNPPEIESSGLSVHLCPDGSVSHYVLLKSHR